MCDPIESMEPSQPTDDDISVGSNSPMATPRHDTDDSMIDVDDSGDGGAGDKGAAGPKVEPPDPAMSPGPPRTPPAAHQANNAPLHRALKFSIDNILKPDFGRRLEDSLETSEQPVDLSRVTARDPKDPNRNVGGAAPQAAGMVMKEQREVGGTLWPAWVYCTRYSDRPSAGGCFSCPLSSR